MENRFETFVTAIMSLYRSIQKIKATKMAGFGLKGSYVMCLFQLLRHPDGLTSAELCTLCEEDKAAISRSVAELEEKGLICRPEGAGKNTYRRKLRLTERGRSVAEEVDALIVQTVDRVGAGLTDDQRENLYCSLAHIAENLRGICDEEEA